MREDRISEDYSIDKKYIYMLYFNLLNSVIGMLCEPRDDALQPRVSPTLSTLSGSGSFKTVQESIITLPFISPLVKSLPFNDHTTLVGHGGDPVRKQHFIQIIGAL